MYDYHTHTFFSDDSSTPMTDMIEAAYRKGFKEIALTDHYDPDCPDKEYPFILDTEKYHEALLKAEIRYSDKIELIKGIEIGIQHGKTLDRCSDIISSFPYDFVIGSFHCADGYELYSGRFFNDRSVEKSYIAFYSYMLDCLKQYRDYDVVGHFNIIDRYTERIPDSSVYMDLVEEILKQIIADGKGIEINTSSFRYGLGNKTTPSQEILERYAALGGEIITIGSDAHKTEDIGDHFDYAFDMMRSVDIKYLTTYLNRKPSFIKI